MMRGLRAVFGVGVVSLVVLSGLSFAADTKEPALSGSITATATSAALGVGWSWGKGTLTLLDGSEHHFKVSGLDVVAVGFKQSSLVGKVYNLKQVQDFAGTYAAGAAGLVVGGGAGALTMRNEKGVIINATGVGEGVSLNLSSSGVTIKLQD